jgi:exopolyphosphatase/guanosine-5'-triphosphate,3'-diphosphate pyrophosphatase
MAIFKRTSRFGFHLLREVKSRARISENAYKNGGRLQQTACDRAIGALKDFAQIARSCGARKILAVATSAVRDAPNRSEFIGRARKECGINIRVIDGKEEALAGGLAALNLLKLTNGVTIDIGGGSTEFALIKDGRIADTVSFNLGTVRLKELFFDERIDQGGAYSFVESAFAALPDHFRSDRLIGVGGTLRALSSVLMNSAAYPFDVLHGYEFKLAKHADFFERVIRADESELKSFGFKTERLDVIRQGVLIFTQAAKRVGAQTAVTSGVGVREGVFLRDLLRSNGGRLPNDIQPSLVSLCDRFVADRKEAAWQANCASKLFVALKDLLPIDEKHKMPLLTAARLLSIGDGINPYHPLEEGAALARNGLSYGFAHDDRLLIAALIESANKKAAGGAAVLPKSSAFKPLLPSEKSLQALALILYLTRAINAAKERPTIAIEVKGKSVVIGGLSYLAAEALARFKPPFNLELSLFKR